MCVERRRKGGREGGGSLVCVERRKEGRQEGRKGGGQSVCGEGRKEGRDAGRKEVSKEVNQCAWRREWRKGRMGEEWEDRRKGRCISTM